MAGDPTKATVWPDADVYVGPLTATAPATLDDEFSGDWDLVGLLDGEQGFVHAREWGTNDEHYAWGGILVRKVRSQFKHTVTFTALEDNDTTRELIWPGSPSGKLVVPRPAQVKIAFETREGNYVRRLITEQYAEVEINGDITDAESDLTRYELLATIFPTGDGELFTEQKGELTPAP